MRTRIRYVLVLLVVSTIILAGCGPTGTNTPETTDSPEVTRTPVEPETIQPPTQPEATKPPIAPEATRPPARPEFSCEPLEPPAASGFDPARYALSEAGLYLEGLVAVTGMSESGSAGADIDAVMQQVWDTATPPAYLDEIMLDGLVIRLYDYTDNEELEGLTVWEVVLAVYLAALRQNVNVFGDPDYLLGAPWDIQGSPWDIQGSPWDIQGSPWATAAQGMDLDEYLFWEQWAFEDKPYGIGITPQDNGGAKMRLAIFDTSPFQESGPYVFDLEGPDLQLCVSHPLPVVAPQGSHDYKEHGLAVAGLAHAVAPESEIDFIRVLNDGAEGDLFTLLKSMSLFLQRVIDERGYTIVDEHTLINVIINLSLGFRPEYSTPPDNLVYLLNSELEPGDYLASYPVPTTLQERLQEWIDLDEEEKINRIKALRDKLELVESEAIPVPAFRFLIRFATARDAILVAAAGNEHSDVSQRPALWPEVIGVGASNISAGQSCYSSAGDVYAPGGNGDGSCTSQLQLCAEDPYAECPYGMISLVTLQDPEIPPEEGVTAHQYAYLVGTSFSTPLVSGLVALHEIPAQNVPSLIQTGELAEMLGVIYIP
ncbi:MAG: S8 family serine peptidase [Anaerolineae bacterium]|nr:S8 family serine peptidase [Anaerolineae bacterium]